MKITPPHGPATNWPTDDAVSTLESARTHVLSALEQLATPSTVERLAESLGLHANTVRHHLAAARREGFVERSTTTDPSGPGRPAARYALTGAGRAAVGRARGVAGEYLGLLAAMAEGLAANRDAPGEEARAIGRSWGQVLRTDGNAGPVLGNADTLLISLLERLGFAPHRPLHDSTGPDTVLLRSCPLVDTARRHPDVICQVHRGLIEGVLAGADEHGEVELRPFDRPGACTLILPASV